MTTAAASNAVSAIPKLMSTAAAMDYDESTQAPTDTKESNANESVSTSSMDRTQNQLIMRTASRIGLHMLREDMTQDSQLAGSSAPHIQQEHFVINSCKVFVDVILPESATEGWLFISPKKRQEIIDSIPTTVPFAHTLSEQPYLELYDRLELSESAKEDGTKILQLIANKKEMGIVVSELPHVVGSLSDPACSLEQHVSFLVDSRVVQKVGVVAQRFVAIQYIDPWVIKSFRLLRSGKEKLEPFNSAHMLAKHNEDKSQPEADIEEGKMSATEGISVEETSMVPAESKENLADSQQENQMEEEMEACQPGESRAEETTAVVPDGIVTESANEVVPGRRKRRLSTYHPSSKKSRTVDSLGTR